MVGYVKRYSRLCSKVFSLSTSEDGTSETFGNSPITIYSRMEVEHITMNFVVDLPRTHASYDAIWVIVDRLIKSAHFLTVCNNFFLNRLAELYVDEIVKLYGVPVSTVSDRDLKFRSRF